MSAMLDEQWQAYGRQVEAHLAQIEAQIGQLRDTLRAAGIDVRRQRTRVQPENERAREALTLLREQPTESWRPSEVARHLGVTPEYAYDLLAALVARGEATKTGRGRYRVRD
jgi:predicted Rossmann fold nucleotide-binding protein DprA/Smf involved in DNA uptake